MPSSKMVVEFLHSVLYTLFVGPLLRVPFLHGICSLLHEITEEDDDDDVVGEVPDAIILVTIIEKVMRPEDSYQGRSTTT